MEEVDEITGLGTRRKLSGRKKPASHDDISCIRINDRRIP